MSAVVAPPLRLATTLVEVLQDIVESTGNDGLKAVDEAATEDEAAEATPDALDFKLV